MVVSPHPSFSKFARALQREQSMQEALLAKWEEGDAKKFSKPSIACDDRILELVRHYETRKTLTYLKGIAFHLEF